MVDRGVLLHFSNRRVIFSKAGECRANLFCRYAARLLKLIEFLRNREVVDVASTEDCSPICSGIALP